MTELAKHADTFLKYQQRFIDLAMKSAAPLHLEWLQAKYERLATYDIQAIIDEANTAKMQYAAAFNHLAALHGVGIRDCEAAPVESPVVHLAHTLDGESLVLSGRETAAGIAPLTAKIGLYTPHNRFGEQTFGHVYVELTDPNTDATFGVSSFLSESWIDSQKIQRGCDENEILKRAKSLRAEIVRDCSREEYIAGCSPAESIKGIYESTSPRYHDTLLSQPWDRDSGIDITKGTRLRDTISTYVESLTDQTDRLQSNIDLLEWLVACAGNAELNPLLVERMEGSTTPSVSVEPDTYAIIPRDNDTSTMRIWPITLAG